MSKNPTLTNPRESFVNPPLTTPLTDIKPLKPTNQVSCIIRQLRLRKAGHDLSEQPWTIFQLLPDDFEQLIALLKADESLWGFFEDKVHYDYFSRSDRFILRRPLMTHASFCSRVAFEIHEQLRVVGTETGEAAEFAKNVSYQGSPTLQFPADEVGEEGEASDEDGDEEKTASSKYNSHDPDAVFRHWDAQWPCIIIEVSFPQKEKELKNLAQDYILGSDGNIRVVIGLNIEYEESKKATISVWRPQYVKHRDGQEYLIPMQTVLNQEFRDDLGNLVTDPATGLELLLKDFASEAIAEDPNTINHRVFISSSTLYDFLTRAEARAKFIKEGKGRKTQLKPGTRKRRRQKTPPEKLKSDDG